MGVEKLSGLLLLGVAVAGISYHYSRQFLDWLRFQSLGTRDYIVEKLGLMFVETPPERILVYMFLLSFGLGAIVFLLIVPNLGPAVIFGLIATVIGWKLPRPIVDYLYRRRVRLFVSQMVDGLGLMSNGLKSGLSVVQALNLVVQEMPNPMKQEFNLVMNENKLGVSLEEAFNNLARRVPAEDVEMFVTAINILKETGGNLAETFDTIVLTIRERVKIENKIAAMTAQGFYQGMIVMAVPPLLGVVISQSDPEFMEPLLTTPVGWAILVVILLLELVGLFVILRVIKIEV
ncbi:MAG: type II secretion system F family protein [Oligoflexia bacterium]